MPDRKAATTWNGALVPAGAAQPIRAKLNADIVTALHSPGGARGSLPTMEKQPAMAPKSSAPPSGTRPDMGESRQGCGTQPE